MVPVFFLSFSGVGAQWGGEREKGCGAPPYFFAKTTFWGLGQKGKGNGAPVVVFVARNLGSKGKCVWFCNPFWEEGILTHTHRLVFLMLIGGLIFVEQKKGY